jgi:ketosteroid isomerase-like protein
MSQTNVEIVRRCLEAFASGDFDGAFSAFGPDPEWSTAADEPDQQTYRGIPGLRHLVRDLAEPWIDRFEGVMEFEAFIDGGDWVVVPWHARVRGRGSGIPVDVSETWAVRVEEAKIVRVEEYRSKGQALESVGFRPNG